jgi:hypothetical protein
VRSPLVHIGYHKTATSWLQQRVFDDPRSGFRRYPRVPLARRLIEAHPFAFDARACRAELDPWIQETRERDLVPVFSHERLSGYPSSGGFDSLEILERIAAVLPEARVLLTVREQRAAIVSDYRQYVRDGGASPLKRYLDPPQMGHRRVPGFAVEFFQFDRLAKAYGSQFGTENVCVLVYEQFRSDPAAFLGRLGAFARTDADLGGLDPASTQAVVNPAPSPAALAILRWVNLLFRPNPLHPSPPFPSKSAAAVGTRVALALDRLPLGRLEARRAAAEQAVVAERVDGLYDESNARLSELAGLDLERYGYAVRSTALRLSSHTRPAGRVGSGRHG